MGASDELDDAVIDVARTAEELSTNAEAKGAGFFVSAEDMQDLRRAIARWKEATRKYLALNDDHDPEPTSDGWFGG